VNALQEQVADLKRAGRPPKLLYTIPTFHNPTGVNLSAGRRRGLLKIAAQERLLIVEDDVYRELAYDAPAPPSLWSLAPEGVVLRIGSFAKSLAPGIRLGWLTGKGEFVQRMAAGGLRDSGGGVNHFAAMMVAALCKTGLYDAQVENLRDAYRTRRDALMEKIHRELPEATFVEPGGGFFVWLTFENGMDTQVLRGRAPEHGVDFIHGARFFVEGGGTNALRVAFSLYAPKELQEAMRRLRRAIDA
jgi:DNA-binding transcriptional MocR family regulator